MTSKLNFIKKMDGIYLFHFYPQDPRFQDKFYVFAKKEINGSIFNISSYKDYSDLHKESIEFLPSSCKKISNHEQVFDGIVKDWQELWNEVSGELWKYFHEKKKTIPFNRWKNLLK